MRLTFLKRKAARPAAPPAAPPPAPPASPVTDPAEHERLRGLVAGTTNWFHSIDLGQGVVTPGHKSPALLRSELEAQRWPDLRGKSVLDIGAWDGFFSFEAERRGASRVVALDHYSWAIDWAARESYWQECRATGAPIEDCHKVPGIWRYDTLPGRRNYDLVRAELCSKVEPVVGDFMTVDLEALGTFDVVLFLGVLYHTRNPLAALERVCALAKGLAVIETAAVLVPGFEGAPLCHFYEHDELCGDQTNWWAPNAKALEGLCRAAGFRRAEVLRVPDEGTLPRGEVYDYRATAHAWK
ncbi:MAG TPA: methyltransferase domain-containing protein [Gemmataceae bacterium]|nr:methyltransferase domain-containing protein [Gemmataceae bacterium]